MENVLEKVSNLAAEKLKEIKAPAEEKAKAESKAAAEVKAKADADKAKGEGDKLAEVEKKAQEDERILGTDDADLTEPESKRKAELLETKKKKDESPEEKIKRTQDATQKRIDEIKSELLAEKNKRTQDAEVIKKLQEELDVVKKTIQPKAEEDAKAKLKREELDRINKYVGEDKDKPYEDRREMAKEDLEAWYLEDPLAATEWIQERTARRVEERKALETKSKEEETKKTGKQLSDEFIAKQNESKAKLFSKYPGVNPSRERLAELKGKTDSEIRDILCEENEEFKLCSEIVAEDPKKYLGSIEGPELVMAEMEKRLKKPAGKKAITLTEEELEAKIQAEADRRANLDEGISSTKGKKVEQVNKNKSELRQKQEAIAKKAGIKIEDLDKTIERRKSIPGASTFEDSNE